VIFAKSAIDYPSRSSSCNFAQPFVPSQQKMESDRVLDGDDVDYTCPLCVEEFDIHDRNFKPCPCGYQVCPFCWNHIRNNLNGLCPACRRPYSDQPEWKPTAVEEYVTFTHISYFEGDELIFLTVSSKSYYARRRKRTKNIIKVIIPVFHLRRGN
jgi:CCR4-NOT transcription complex subunit 4